jgi:hypothetical protein
MALIIRHPGVKIMLDKQNQHGLGFGQWEGEAQKNLEPGARRTRNTRT